MMARASRKLAISHLAQHAAQRLPGHDDAELLENPLTKIDDSPAHDPMNRRDRPAFQDRRQRRAMLAVQPRPLPWGLAVDQSVGPLRVELEHPVANDLKRHAADLGRLAARGPVVDRRKRQQSPRLRPVLRPFRRRAQRTRVKVTPKPNRRRHREPPAVRNGRIRIQAIRESHVESASTGLGITLTKVSLCAASGRSRWRIIVSGVAERNPPSGNRVGS
jgi:hypothetical protein